MTSPGADRMLFQQHLGPQWTVYGAVAYGKVMLYAINHRDSLHINIDPETGRPDKPGLPEKILRGILHLARDLPTSNNIIHNFSTWLFKWGGMDHGYEIWGEWDPRDL